MIHRGLSLLLVLLVISLVTLTCLYNLLGRDDFRFQRYESSFLRPGQTYLPKLQASTIYPGLTIFGDSYSTNRSVLWCNHISLVQLQNFAVQGATLDYKHCRINSLSVEEIQALPPDLPSQVQSLQFLTSHIIIWFGINDLMTLHQWNETARHAAIAAEHETLFGIVDEFLALGVEHIIIPNVIDFSNSPGLEIARSANQTVAEEVTVSAIQDWNQALSVELVRRPKLRTIDFFSLSREWLSDPQKHGLDALNNFGKVNVRTYLWQDFLHFTPFVHEALLAPQFEIMLGSSM